jgi:hypothetical protein
MKLECVAVLFCCAALPAARAGSEFRFDAAAARWTLAGSQARVENARMGVEIDGVAQWPDKASAAPGDNAVELRFAGPAGVVWTVQFRHAAGEQALEIDSTLRNTGDRAVRIGRVRLLDLSDPSGSLSMSRSTVALLMTGWQRRSQVKRIEGSAEPLVSKTLTQLFDVESGAALNVGFVSFDRAETDVEISWDAARRTAVLSAWCDLAGYTLAPGASVKPEVLRIAVGQDPYTALEAWAHRVHQRYRPPVPERPPAGWVGWSWVDSFNVERYEDVVRRNAEAVRRRLPGLDIGYVWVSIGNLAGRAPGNWLKWNYELFPSGPEKLVSVLGDFGFKLGLWAGAFWVNDQLEGTVDHFRDAFLLHDGKPIMMPQGLMGKMYALDPSHPKTLEMLRNVFGTYRKWGVRYYMLDFVYSVSGATPGSYPNDGYANRALIKGPEAWREGLKAIREAAGDDTYLLLATGPSFQSIGIVNAARTGSDYGEGRPLDGPGKGFYPGTFAINKADYWTSHREGTDALAGNFFTNRELYLADSGNVMTIDQPISVPDAQITTTLFGINGGPVMLGDDIGYMADDRLEMLKKVFPRLPDGARPLDLFDAVAPDYPKLFHLKVRREWGTWDLLACFNYGQATLHREVDLKRLGLDPAAGYVAWDFWNQRYLGVARSGKVAFDVPPGSVRVLRIAAERAHPWLLSTDLHVRQGQAEIADCRWDAEKSVLTIRAERPQGSKGSLFLRAPKGWAMAEPGGFAIGKDMNDESLIIRRGVEFGAGPVEVRAAFKRVPEK